MSSNSRNNRPGGRKPKVAGAPRGLAARQTPDVPETKPTTPEPAQDATPVEPRRPRKVPVVKRGAGSSLRPAAAEPTVAPAVEAPTETTETTETTEAVEPDASELVAAPVAGRGKSGRLSWKLVAILGVIAVLLGALATVAAFKPGAKVSNKAFIDNSQTDEVKAAAQAAMVTLYAYNDKTIDKYPDAARSVLTADMRKDFEKGLKTTVDGVKQAKTSVDAHVDPVGVTVLDGNRAELLANLTVSAANNGVAQGSASGPEVIRMEKVDGKWLISGIVDR